MNLYRECSRNIWNSYLGVHENSRQLEPQYEQIRKLLFEALVVNDIESGAHASGKQATPVLKVVPFPTMPILLRRSSEDGNVYWDQEPDLRFEGEKITLAFIDYYDFFQAPV